MIEERWLCCASTLFHVAIQCTVHSLKHQQRTKLSKVETKEQHLLSVISPLCKVDRPTGVADPHFDVGIECARQAISPGGGVEVLILT
jgi:hypothetical protein